MLRWCWHCAQEAGVTAVEDRALSTALSLAAGPLRPPVPMLSFLYRLAASVSLPEADFVFSLESEDLVSAPLGLQLPGASCSGPPGLAQKQCLPALVANHFQRQFPIKRS